MPAAIPVNTPVVLFMVPVAGVLIDHVPPAAALLKVTVGKPIHTDDGPVIGAGVFTTVITIVAAQPATR